MVQVMKTSNVFIIVALLSAGNMFSLDKKNNPSDYDLAYRNIEILEKMKNLYRDELTSSYEKKRKEYIEMLLKNRATINMQIQKIADEKRISDLEYSKLLEKSFASLADMNLLFPPLNLQNIDKLLEDIP